MEIGFIGLLILALDVWALINIWGSGASGGGKLLWSLLVLFFPVGGLLIWLLFGPRGRSSAA